MNTTPMLTAGALRAATAHLADNDPVPLCVRYNEVACKYIFVRIDALTVAPEGLRLTLSLVDGEDEDEEDDE